jgi:hypothetical protein
MARIWKEPYRGQSAGPGWHIPKSRLRAPALDSQELIAVRVCSFTFYFISVEQLKAYLDYFSRKTHPSSRLRMPARADTWIHWEAQRWYERLPMYLFEEPKRQKVEKALTKALDLSQSGKL